MNHDGHTCLASLEILATTGTDCPQAEYLRRVDECHEKCPKCTPQPTEAPRLRVIPGGKS